MTAKTTVIVFLFVLLNLLTRSQQVQYNLSASAVLIKQYNFNFSLSIFPSKGIIAINMSGPSYLWFGVGFNNTIMANTYAIVCSKDSTNKAICQENKLGQYEYGEKLSATINVLNDNTNNNMRKIYLTRNVTITDQSYFSFPTWTASIDIIFAVGYNSDSFTSASSMGPGGTMKLNITNRLSNNLTVNARPLGYNIVLNSIIVYPDENIVQINITGPSNVYFGIGFNSTVMGLAVYVIVCDSNGCHENELTGQSYGVALKSTTNIIYENSINDKRTVVINRKCNITASDTTDFDKYFQFPVIDTTIPIIYAIGSSNIWSANNPMSFDPYTYGTVNIEFVKIKPLQNILYAHRTLFSEDHQTVNINVFPFNNIVNMTLTGPTDRWFGIGFNKTQMSNAYAIVCSDEPLCFEQLLATGVSGQRFPQQHIIITSDSSNNGIRTVKLKRKQNITRNDDANFEYFFSFPSLPSTIPIIYAYGINDIFNSSLSHMANEDIGTLSFTNYYKIYNLTASLNLFSSVGESIKIDVFPLDDKVIITFSGPINRWYGIGFDNTFMNNTYAIIVQGNGNAIVQEQILGTGSPGYKLQTQNIIIESDTTNGNIRTVQICRAISIYDTKVYDFPIEPTNVDIIYAYGSNYSFDTSTYMSLADNNILEFNQMSNGNSSLCVNGIVDYGKYAYVNNGLYVGLYIYCKTKIIQMQIDYINYEPNWFGIVFNTVMTPSPNATIFTTGKATEIQRSIGLYSYDLRAKDMSDIIYHPDRNWRKIKQSIYGKNVSLTYEQDLSMTKWNTSTTKITFRYAWGTASDGTQLSQHTSSDFSTVYTFTLANIRN